MVKSKIRPSNSVVNKNYSLECLNMHFLQKPNNFYLSLKKG